MPIPKPEPLETMSEVITRCMDDDTMQEEDPNERQRVAVCAKQWTKK